MKKNYVFLPYLKKNKFNHNPKIIFEKTFNLFRHTTDTILGRTWV